MKKINIVIVLSLFFASAQLHSQNSSLQIGFGMQQNVHLGSTIILDSILIKPYKVKDDFRPVGIIWYQKRFKDKFEIEIGFSYSKTYNSYIVGLYDTYFHFFTRKVGVRVSHAFTFPLNINVALTNNLYAKVGISATLGILNPYNPIYFDDTPVIDNIYNSMQNIFKPNSVNYSFGGGYKIWRFDIVYFRKIAINKVTKPINVNNKDYEIFGKFYSNTISVFYNFILK